MSQFRIKNIDTGIIDSWVFRIDDVGIIPGDDIVAQDPNELAQAVSDTQHEILKTGIHAPGVLINATEGALSRIKTIEDTVGSTSLQDAYDNGRFISVQPGLPLSLGALGEIVLDSSGNLSVNANTFKITDGSNDMFISETGVSSTTSDLTFGPLSATNDATFTSGRDFFLKDSHLSSSITLSESGAIALSTTSQSLVGAINEISGGFTGTDFQQIYDQSAPATVTTSFSRGPISFINGSGNPSTPALSVNGGMSLIDFIDADKLTIGPGIIINATIESDGRIHTLNNLETTTKVISPRVENTLGELTLVDSRGVTTLTENSDPTLLTTKQSLFGSINEIDTLSNQNAGSLALLDLEHNLVSGIHEIINTQADPGDDALSRFNIKNSVGSTQISMDALGEITAVDMTLGIYDMLSETAANVAHRGNDGTGHSAVATHFGATNPHGTVNTFAILGDTALADDVTIEAGTGITMVRSGQNITLSTLSGTTLQGVYDTQANGFLDLNTNSSKNLIFRDSNSLVIAELKDTAVEINKELKMIAVSAQISAVSELDIVASSDLTVGSTTDSVSLLTPGAGGTVKVNGVDFDDGTGIQVIDSSVQSNVVGAINDLAKTDYLNLLNGTGALTLKGTAVSITEDGFWIPSPNSSPSSLSLEAPLGAQHLWRVVGVADEDIAAGVVGRIRTSGTMSADIGMIDAITNFGTGCILYIARRGYSEIEVEGSTITLHNDTITLDTAGAAKVFTAKSSGAVEANGEFNIDSNPNANIRADITRDALMSTLNNRTYMDAGNDFFISASIAGQTAKGTAVVTAIGSVGNTLTLTPAAGIPGATIVLTAVANGTSPSWLQYELGLTTEGTARNIADAINRTHLFDGADSSVAGQGHVCLAEAYSTEIEITWIGAGKRGNALALSTTGGTVTVPASLTGGTSKIKVQRSERNANGILCSASAPSGVSCANFTDDEGLSQYLNETAYLFANRNRDEDDRRVKVGRVLLYGGGITTFEVCPAEPIRNRKRIKGFHNDIEH